MLQVKSVCGVIAVTAVTASFGCSDFETIRRSDGSQARLLRRVDSVWPVYANTFTLLVKPDIKLPQASGGVEFKVDEQVVRLYEEMDQYNAQLRNLLVWYYAIYQNGELDNEPARDKYRMIWIELGTRLAERSLELRIAFDSQVRERLGEGKSEPSAVDIEDLRQFVSKGKSSLIQTASEVISKYSKAD